MTILTILSTRSKEMCSPLCLCSDPSRSISSSEDHVADAICG